MRRFIFNTRLAISYCLNYWAGTWCPECRTLWVRDMSLATKKRSAFRLCKNGHYFLGRKAL